MNFVLDIVKKYSYNTRTSLPNVNFVALVNKITDIWEDAMSQEMIRFDELFEFARKNRKPVHNPKNKRNSYSNTQKRKSTEAFLKYTSICEDDIKDDIEDVKTSPLKIKRPTLEQKNTKKIAQPFPRSLTTSTDSDTEEVNETKKHIVEVNTRYDSWINQCLKPQEKQTKISFKDLINPKTTDINVSTNKASNLEATENAQVMAITSAKKSLKQNNDVPFEEYKAYSEKESARESALSPSTKFSEMPNDLDLDLDLASEINEEYKSSQDLFGDFNQEESHKSQAQHLTDPQTTDISSPIPPQKFITPTDQDSSLKENNSSNSHEATEATAIATPNPWEIIEYGNALLGDAENSSWNLDA